MRTNLGTLGPGGCRAQQRALHHLVGHQEQVERRPVGVDDPAGSQSERSRPWRWASARARRVRGRAAVLGAGASAVDHHPVAHPGGGDVAPQDRLAVGDRQMFPQHTNSTRYGSGTNGG